MQTCDGLNGNEPHYWNSQLRERSMVVESDWCINCGVPRPGYLDPRKKWDTK